MKYKNSVYRKVRGAFRAEVSCASCGQELTIYHKKGRGNLINMYITRIEEANVDLKEKLLLCPSCGEEIGVLMEVKKDKSLAYKMYRSKYRMKTL